eukprot:TRINITY_DN3232_c0_g1_i1.p1 TRINITY_DN3232_c0_g1~~TRINITY_DN3232_c0_g1_i1.p1  ORF type:complete len:286 (-),score=67.14 TRINITY_DN3232_c0_g1_i1:141-998(-)
MITEFRVPLPLTVDEFQVAQLFMVVKLSEENTGGGEGVEWLKNEPYDNTDGHLTVSEISGVEIPKTKGQYTLKKYHIASKIPGVVRAMLPKSSMFLYEEAFNAYPHCKTILTNGYLLPKKFKIIVESIHLCDDGHTENVFNLPDDILKKRKVEFLDIRNNPEKKEEYKEEFDCKLFHSEKTGRGPLVHEGWQKDAKPVMCCYKLMTVDFKYWGLQKKIEKNTEKFNHGLFEQSLGTAFCMIDEWFGLTMDDIRKMEEDVKVKLGSKIQEGAPKEIADEEAKPEAK